MNGCIATLYRQYNYRPAVAANVTLPAPEIHETSERGAQAAHPILAQQVQEPPKELEHEEENEEEIQNQNRQDDEAQGGSDTDSNVEDTTIVLRDFLLEYHQHNTDIIGYNAFFSSYIKITIHFRRNFYHIRNSRRHASGTNGDT